MKQTKHSELIDQLGGTVEVARLCNVTKGAVSQWRSAGIPAARMMYLQAVRPDVDWAYLRGTNKEAA